MQWSLVSRLVERRYLYMAVMSVLVVREVGVALTINAQALYVDLRDNHAALHLKTVAYLQHVAVLGYIGATREDDVRGRFADARRGIYVSAVYACGLLGDHALTKLVLARHAVAAR